MRGLTSVLLFVALACVTSTSRASVFVGSFPDGSETRFTMSGSRFWNVGDFIEQDFLNTGLTFAESINLDLNIGANSLAGDTQDMDVILNGTTIGSFSISSGDAVVPINITGFNVAATGIDDFLLRLETNRTVLPGRGSAGIAAGSNNLTLANAMNPAIPEASAIAIWSLLGLFGVSVQTRRRCRA